jgi:hypothetical protein
LTFALLAGLSASAVAEEPAGGPDLELAKAHYRTGEIYYERNRFPDAAREFEEAFRLSKRPELLYNMGKSYDGVGDHAKALGAYRRFLAAVAVSPDRAAVEERVISLEKLVGRVTIRASVEGAAVEVDGNRVGKAPLEGPLELNPGGHKIEVSAEGYRTWRGTAVAAPGKESVVDAQLESMVKVQVVKEVVEVERRKKVPVYKQWWLWTAVGLVVAAGAITAGVLGSQEPPIDGPHAQLPSVRLP